MTVEFGFHKAEYVSSDGFHVVECIKDIGAVVVRFETIYILEVNADYLRAPDFRIISRVISDESISFAVVGSIEKVLEASANIEVGAQYLGGDGRRRME